MLEESKPTPIGGLFSIVSPLQISATGSGDDDDLPYDIRLDLEVEDGRFVVTSMTANRRDGGAAITGTGLRKVVIDWIIQQALFADLVRLRKDDVQPLTWFQVATAVSLDDDMEGDEETIGRLPRFLGNVSSPANEASDKGLTTVAALYQIAFALGSPPVQAVAERLGVSPSTARGRIARAREKGLLPPTVKGKANG